MMFSVSQLDVPTPLKDFVLLILGLCSLKHILYDMGDLSPSLSYHNTILFVQLPTEALKQLHFQYSFGFYLFYLFKNFTISFCLYKHLYFAHLQLAEYTQSSHQGSTTNAKYCSGFIVSIRPFLFFYLP